MRRKSREKKSNFVEKPNKDIEIYRNGAIAGSIVGLVTGFLIKKKILLCAGIGALIGGYIAYEINKGDSSIPSFKKVIKA
jgi:uncharacterized protein YcfJ